MKANRLLVSATLIILVCALWACSNSPDASSQKNTTTQTPNVKAKEIVFKNYDKQGLLTSIIQAQEVHHQQHDQLEFIKPRVVTQRPPWEISAEKAYADKNHQIELTQKVELLEKNNKVDPTQIHTEQLFYSPKQKKMHTKARIVLTKGDLSITALGMHADLNQQSIHFLQHVIIHNAKVKISANEVICHLKQQKLSQLELIGNAKIQDKQQTFQADHINYNLEQQRIITKKNQHHKTEILFNRDIITLPRSS